MDHEDIMAKISFEEYKELRSKRPILGLVHAEPPKIKRVKREIKDNRLMDMGAVAEYQFHNKRKFKFDYAFVDKKIAVEQEGGIFTKQAHGSITGILRDMEKYNLAVECGWRVLRYVPGKFDYDQIKKVLDGDSY